MSALPVVNPSSGDPRPSARPGLRLVPQPAARLARVPFLMVLAGILALGMIGLLLLNITLQAQAFQANQLQRQAAELRYAEGEMQQRVVEAGSSRELTRKASELGMRPNRAVAYVTLPTGEVSGEPGASDGSYLPSAVTRTDAELEQMRVEKALKAAEERRAEEQKTLDGYRKQILDAQARERAQAEQEAARAADAQSQNQSQPEATQTRAPQASGR